MTDSKEEITLDSYVTQEKTKEKSANPKGGKKIIERKFNNAKSTGAHRTGRNDNFSKKGV